MEVGVAVSELPTTSSAAEEAVERAMEALSGPAHLVVTFFTSEHRRDAEQIAAAVGSRCDGAILGASAQGLLGAGSGSPAVVVWAAHLPGCEIHPFSLSHDETTEGSVIVGLPEIDPAPELGLLVADAFSFRSQDFTRLFNRRYPGVPIAGGSASPQDPGQSAVLIDASSTQPFGAKGVLLGGVDAASFAAHSSRPTGPAITVTAAEDNLIYELGGKPPLERLREVLQRLPEEQASSVRDGVGLGLAMEDLGDGPFPDEYVVRDLSFANLESGAFAVDLPLEVGSVVRFHIPDPESASASLNAKIDGLRQTSRTPKGLLAFASEPLGPIEGIGLAGMVCREQFTSVSGRAAVQNRTAALALFF